MTKSTNTVGGRFTAFLILAAISVAILLAGLVLGTEQRLVIERTGERVFRVTTLNQFAGTQFFTKTIEGVEDVTVDNALRDDRRDSQKEQRRRRNQKHLDFFGSDGARVGWDRESDYGPVSDFMRGQEETLSLADPLPTWRKAIAWFLVGLGALSFIGAIQNSLFPKKLDPNLEKTR